MKVVWEKDNQKTSAEAEIFLRRVMNVECYPESRNWIPRVRNLELRSQSRKYNMLCREFRPEI